MDFIAIESIIGIQLEKFNKIIYFAYQIGYNLDSLNDFFCETYSQYLYLQIVRIII